MPALLVSYLRRHHVALLALVVAMGGTAYAAGLPRGSVGTAQLKAGAVTSAKVKNGSLLAADFRRGQLPRGATGPQGPQGVAGPPGISNYQKIETIGNVSPGDTFVQISASCPTGTVLLGGGGVVQDSKLHITYLNPQVNDVMALTAVLIPGQTITQSSQAFVRAICGTVQ